MVTSSQRTRPTSALWRTAAWRRKVSYEMIRMGVAARRPYCVMKVPAHTHTHTHTERAFQGEFDQNALL